MQFTFIDMAGKTLFTRNDATRALWTVEEYSLELEFPYKTDKVVSIGQRIFFVAPGTGAHQIYEVKQAQTFQPDGYQQIVAEHICVSELSDEHINEASLTNVKCATALETVLAGTLWSVGNKLYNKSTVDVSRGSVWQAILQIKSNWNVYIEPRVTLANSGAITRYLDIVSTDGVWNGVRLSVDKNMVDPSVTYDDSQVYTALYGYGGTITSTDPNVDNKECDFANVVWTATSEHPAKPKGQKYLLDPTATAQYGRNGRARYGYYQNTDITDPEILLQKTWETLQTVSSPSVSVEGSVADLYRLGYADQPLSLHDIALVDIAPVGYKKQIQIIRLTVDLLDPTATSVTIGAYIPNIIYINKETNEDATGSRGGGGGNTSKESTWREFRTTIDAYQDGTGMQIRAVQNDLTNTKEEVAVQEGRIEVTYNKITQEVIDRREYDNILAGRITVEKDRITAEVTRAKGEETKLSGRLTITEREITQEVTNRERADATLSGRITVTSEAITQEVTRATTAEGTLSGRITVNSDKVSIVVEDDGAGGYKPNSASIVAGINGQTGSYVKIKADTINLSGYVTASQLSATDAKIDNLMSGTSVATALYGRDVHATIGFTCKGYATLWKQININGTNYYILCHN